MGHAVLAINTYLAFFLDSLAWPQILELEGRSLPSIL